ncbi:hypothetical protein V1477_006644 [Vespula maculifrons]|uniref:Uncharacterized protein n=1 Tax=Vespula maculifrons TaxID=7453 RepID=A0ABD2CJF9_VESMC
MERCFAKRKVEIKLNEKFSLKNNTEGSKFNSQNAFGSNSPIIATVTINSFRYPPQTRRTNGNVIPDNNLRELATIRTKRVSLMLLIEPKGQSFYHQCWVLVSPIMLLNTHNNVKQNLFSVKDEIKLTMG